jgi:ubiquinone/menaquinone biosynthesis C-methylase UbiE
MSTITPQLEQILGKVIADLGGTALAALAIIGDRLGLYKTLAEIGPTTSAELAQATGTNERMVREWLAAQAASGYVTYDGETKQFRMTEEQRLVLADTESPFYMGGGFYSAAATVHDEPKLAEAFRTGKGIGWGDHCNCLFCGVERFYRTGYAANLVQSWLPALDDVVGKLESGGLVADVGCGHGASTLVMARAFPRSRFVGFDYHGPSIERATTAAREQGLSNARFEIGTAQDFPQHAGSDYDLIAVFDALHDMGDPRGAARQALRRLKKDGTWMIVEPAAADDLAGNLNPVGRVYYAMSTSVCVPTAMSQTGGEALGAQAGPAAIADVVTSGGFTRFRTAAATPFNLVFEARP